MIEFKTTNGRTVFIELEFIWCVEETVKSVNFNDGRGLVTIWAVHTKAGKTYNVFREIALGIVDILQLGIPEEGAPYPDDGITPPPHHADDEEHLEEWEKDPEDWKGNPDADGNN